MADKMVKALTRANFMQDFLAVDRNNSQYLGEIWANSLVQQALVRWYWVQYKAKP